MRATWFTSLVAGAIFGVLCRVVDTTGDEGMIRGFTRHEAFCALFIVFIFSVVFAVGGYSQLREMFAQRDRRGFPVVIGQEEFTTTFYFPVWGRMLIWFSACAVAAFASKAWGL